MLKVGDEVVIQNCTMRWLRRYNGKRGVIKQVTEAHKVERGIYPWDDGKAKYLVDVKMDDGLIESCTFEENQVMKIWLK